jgi:hypothetical protein
MCVYYCSTYYSVCVFITAGPSTKLFAWGGGDIGGHVLRGPVVIKHRDDEPRPVWTSLPITH